jgi:hypothetical protein
MTDPAFINVDNLLRTAIEEYLRSLPEKEKRERLLIKPKRSKKITDEFIARMWEDHIKFYSIDIQNAANYELLIQLNKPVVIPNNYENTKAKFFKEIEIFKQSLLRRHLLDDLGTN